MIPMFKVRMNERAILESQKVLYSGMIGEGPKVAEFKRKLEAFFNCDNLLLLNSCSSALSLALQLEDIGQGDEVISTPFTMIATNTAIANTGATIVWADINFSDLNISHTDVKRKITSKTKAIVITHVGGHPCNMGELNKLGIPIIADCAHSIGSYYGQDHISKTADYSCFSFQAIKHLTCGDGGCIVIKSKSKYERAEKLKWFGMTRIVPEGITRLEHQMTADVEEAGYKYHMNDISAAIGLGNLPLLNDTLETHTNNGYYYNRELDNISKVQTTYLLPTKSSSYWLYPILVDNREKFIVHMTDNNIQVSPMWRRNDEYSAFGYPDYQLNVMNEVAKKVVFIPVGWWLTEKDTKYIVDTIRRFYD